VLCKVLAHNICVLIQAMHALNVHPILWGKIPPCTKKPVRAIFGAMPVQSRISVQRRNTTHGGWVDKPRRALPARGRYAGWVCGPWAKALEAMRSFARCPSSARRPYCLKPSEKRSKVYGVAEYLMMLQEVETVRLNRQAREVPTRSRNEMEDRRVPNLEEMDEQEAYRLLAELLSNLSPEEEYYVRHQEDYVMEMPLSGGASGGGRT
jgi:hypothetical protein